MKKAFYILITILFLLVMLVIILELSLRLFWNGKPPIPRFPPNPMYHPDSDPEISYTLIPNHLYCNRKGNINTNKYGFRVDPSINEFKPDGVYRVVLLGDSIIFGVGAVHKETIGEVLETKLNTPGMQGVDRAEVINLGMPGHNISQYYAVYKKYGVKYSPDLVVVGITISNDLEGRQARYLGEGHLYLEPITSFSGYNSSLTVPRRIISSSFVWRYIYFKFIAPRREKEIKKIKILCANRPPKILLAPSVPDDDVWQKTEEALEKIDTFARKNDSNLLFILIPAVQQVYYDDIPRSVQALLKEKIKKIGRRVLDFYEPFKEFYTASGRLPYSDFSSHPDRTGYEIIGSAVCDWVLMQRGKELKTGFSGTVDLGRKSDSRFLSSYGWGKRKKTGSIKYRNIESARGRIIFDRFKETVSKVEILASEIPGCKQGKVEIYLNDELMGKIALNNANGFSSYIIETGREFRLNTENTLDIKVSKLCKTNKKVFRASKMRFQSCSVAKIKLE